MAAAGPFPSYTSRPSFGRRASAFVAALAINVLLIVMLLTLAQRVTELPKPNPNPVTFELYPERSRSDTSRSKARARTERAAAAPERRPAAEPAPPAPAQEAEAPPPPLNMLILSREDFAAADIGRMPQRAQGGAPAEGQAGQQSASNDSAGDGPAGEKLYPADWFRRPTRAELDYYLPKNAPENAWGMIACQTIPRNRVDNCRELGDAPAGLGLARAIKEAAWQFQVLPPRINGKPQIGAWVRIRIEIVRGGVEAR